MAEKVKILEVDIDFDRLIADAAKTNQSIEQLKQQIRSYKKNIKESGDANGQTAVALEKTSVILRDQQKTYRQMKSAIDANKGAREASKKARQGEMKIIEATGGSINQLSAALNKNKALYRNLTQAERENDKIGGKLLRTIETQDKEYKRLQNSIGTTQVNVGDYKNAIQEALMGNKDYGQALGSLSQRIPVVGGLLSKLITTLTAQLAATKAQSAATKGQKATTEASTAATEAQATATAGATVATEGATAATGGLSGAMKILRIALISTGIGAIVVALGALIAAFVSTQEGTDKLNKLLVPLKVALKKLWGMVQDVSKDLFDAFSHPQEAVKKLWKTIKQNIVNRIMGVGKLFKALGKIISSGFTSGYKDLGNAALQMGTGVENVIDKVTGGVKKFGKEISKAVDEGAKIAQLQIDIEKGENRLILLRAKSADELKKQELIAKDYTKSTKERQAALKKVEEITNNLNKAEKEQVDRQIEQLQLKQKQNDTSRTGEESERTLNELKAKRIELDTKSNQDMLRFQGARQKVYNEQKQLDEKRTQTAKKQTQQAIKENQTRLALYIEENKRRTKTLDEELKYAKEISDKKLKILEDEKKAGNKTESEYELEKLKIDNKYSEAQANATVNNAKKELNIWKNAHQKRIENGQFLNDALYNQEIKRLQDTLEKEKKFQKTRLAQGVISQEEYNETIKKIDKTFDDEKKNIDNQKKEDEKEQRSLDYEVQLEENENNFIGRLNLEKDHLQKEYKSKIEAAEKEGKDTTSLKKKQQIEENKIEKAKSDYKIDIASKTFGNFATILGKESAAGKAAAIAQATIDTYKAANSAYASMAGIPIVGPALGAAAAAAAIVAGIANVKQIVKAKDNKKLSKGGKLKGKSHAQGGIPFSVNGQLGFEAEGGEFIVNKKSTKKFLPVLEMINKMPLPPTSTYIPKFHYAGGGRVLNNNIIKQQTTLNINYDLLAEKVAEANAESLPPPIVSVQDIERVDGNQANVTNRALF